MSWESIRGHDHWIRAFENVVLRNRLAHAYLFVGPQGVGKKMFARELAKALLCEDSSTTSPNPLRACDHCPSCHLIDGETHPDLHLVGRPEESNELPIEIMRDLCRDFSLKSARSRGKIAILDDADDLNDASANCFLKTLEEPPPRSTFLLIGSTRDQQLPTILSRCQVIRFAPLPDEIVTNLLREQGAEEALIPRLLRLAEGSPGRALELADPELWKFRHQFLQGLVAKPYDAYSLGLTWMHFIEQAGKDLSVQRRLALKLIRLLLAFLGDALTHSLGEKPPWHDPEEEYFLQHFCQKRGPERILELMERCLEAERQIRRYLQLVLVVEGLLDAFWE